MAQEHSLQCSVFIFSVGFNWCQVMVDTSHLLTITLPTVESVSVFPHCFSQSTIYTPTSEGNVAFD